MASSSSASWASPHRSIDTTAPFGDVHVDPLAHPAAQQQQQQQQQRHAVASSDVDEGDASAALAALASVGTTVQQLVLLVQAQGLQLSQLLGEVALARREVRELAARLPPPSSSSAVLGQTSSVASSASASPPSIFGRVAAGFGETSSRTSASVAAARFVSAPSEQSLRQPQQQAMQRAPTTFTAPPRTAFFEAAVRDGSAAGGGGGGPARHVSQSPASSAEPEEPPTRPMQQWGTGSGVAPRQRQQQQQQQQQPSSQHQSFVSDSVLTAESDERPRSAAPSRPSSSRRSSPVPQHVFVPASTTAGAGDADGSEPDVRGASSSGVAASPLPLAPSAAAIGGGGGGIVGVAPSGATFAISYDVRGSSGVGRAGAGGATGNVYLDTSWHGANDDDDDDDDDGHDRSEQTHEHPGGRRSGGNADASGARRSGGVSRDTSAASSAATGGANRSAPYRADVYYSGETGDGDDDRGRAATLGGSPASLARSPLPSLPSDLGAVNGAGGGDRVSAYNVPQFGHAPTPAATFSELSNEQRWRDGSASQRGTLVATSFRSVTALTSTSKQAHAHAATAGGAAAHASAGLRALTASEYNSSVSQPAGAGSAPTKRSASGVATATPAAAPFVRGATGEPSVASADTSALLVSMSTSYSSDVGGGGGGVGSVAGVSRTHHAAVISAMLARQSGGGAAASADRRPAGGAARYDPGSTSADMTGIDDSTASALGGGAAAAAMAMTAAAVAAPAGHFAVPPPRAAAAPGADAALAVLEDGDSDGYCSYDTLSYLRSHGLIR